MALKPAKLAPSSTTLRLCSFDPAWAELVHSWIRSEQEAYWLAPTTAPPLTADDIRSWARAGRNPLVLAGGGGAQPVAYGELNVLSAERAHYWLGHLIVDAEQRGRGVGQELSRQLLRRAFVRFGAAWVSLVVFPENEQAIACYRRVGFEPDGWEAHELRAYRRRVRLLRMAVSRRAWVPQEC